MAAPPAPQFLPGFPILAGQTIMVMWRPVTGGVNYVLYMNDKKVAEAPVPPLQISAPVEGGTYNLQIAAMDASGSEGPKSAPSQIKIFKLEPPKELEGRFMGGNIALRWKATPAAVSYNVFRSEEKGKNYQMIVSTQMAQYVDSNPAKDKNFHYVVTAKDILGKESGYSPEVVVSTKVEEAKELAGLATNTLTMVPSKHLKALIFFGSQAIRSPVDLIGIGGKLFVVSGASGTVTVLDEQSGDWIKVFGGQLPAQPEAKVGIAFGIGADRRGRIFLCGGSKVVVFDQEGNVLKVINPIPPTDKGVIEAGKKANKGRMPEVAYYDMAEAADGSILLVDNSFGRVLVLDPDTFTLKKEFGKAGFKAQEFNQPGFLAVNPGGDIWINDSMNRRAQVYKSDYTPKFVAGEAKNFVGAFLGMGGVTIDADGNWLIADPPMATVQAFAKENGKYQHHIAEEDLKVDASNNQRPLWRIRNPVGIWLNTPRGLLYICSPQTDEVLVRQILKAKGGVKGSEK